MFIYLINVAHPRRLRRGFAGKKFTQYIVYEGEGKTRTQYMIYEGEGMSAGERSEPSDESNLLEMDGH